MAKWWIVDWWPCIYARWRAILDVFPRQYPAGLPPLLWETYQELCAANGVDPDGPEFTLFNQIFEITREEGSIMGVDVEVASCATGLDIELELVVMEDWYADPPPCEIQHFSDI